METLDELYDKAHDMKIGVYDWHFSDRRKSACVCGKTANILIDRSAMRSRAEEAEKLGHELEHIETGNLYFLLYTSPANRRWCEERTRRSYIKKRIPAEKLLEAVRETRGEIWLIAEYFGCTEELAREAYDYYQSIGLDLTEED